MTIIHTGTDGLYNPLLLGTVNGIEDLATSATEFSPGVSLNPQLDPGMVLVRCVQRVRLRVLILMANSFRIISVR